VPGSLAQRKGLPGDFFHILLDKTNDGFRMEVPLVDSGGSRSVETMIEQANIAIEKMSERERRLREMKYARRNKMRHIDRLLNELEMLNLADQRVMPRALSVAVDQVLEDADVEEIVEQRKPDSVIEAMDLLYEIQDSLMFNQIEDE
jgi:hypothetical protein